MQGSIDVADTINILSLCSGTGGLEIGVGAALEYLGFHPRVLGYCERDSYAASVLLARMEDASLEPAPIWCGDFADMDAESLRGRVDIVAAGFPCQPWSAAGKQKGTEDTRWIWPGIADLIREVRPQVVFLENVPGLVSGGGLEFVLSSLAEMRFDAEWAHLAAASVGASHKRERVFILGWVADNSGKRKRRVSKSTERASAANPFWCGAELGHSARDHISNDEQRELRSREESAGRSGREDVGDTSGKRRLSRDNWLFGETDREGCSNPATRSSDMANPGSARPQERRGERGDSQPEFSAAKRIGDSLAHASSDGGLQATSCSPRGGSDPIERDCELFPPGPGDFDGWGRVVADGSFDFRAPAVKPGLRVLAHGTSLVVDASRADQLRCGGNGVVPLQASVAFVELGRRAGLWQ